MADSQSLIRRIVEAAEVDTVVDTRLVADSVVTTTRRAHENNVIGTLNVLAACGGADSPVRKVVFRSSAHVYGAEQDDPAFFTEETRRRHPPRTAIERDVVEAEGAVGDFAARHPDVTVTVLRFADALGPGVRSSLMALLGLPVVPTILGFEPRFQVLHADDVAGCLLHAVRHDLDGAFNCAADGVLGLGEALSLLGKPAAPVLPPWGTGLAAAAISRTGVRAAPRAPGPAALRPRPRQPPAEGDGLPVHPHDARDGARPAPPAAPGPVPPGPALLPLRARGRGVPALQPERAARGRRGARRAGCSPARGPRRRSPTAPRGRRATGAASTPSRRPTSWRCCPPCRSTTSRPLAAHERDHGARPEVLNAIERLLRARPVARAAAGATCRDICRLRQSLHWRRPGQQGSSALMRSRSILLVVVLVLVLLGSVAGVVYAYDHAPPRPDRQGRLGRRRRRRRADRRRGALAAAARAPRPARAADRGPPRPRSAGACAPRRPASPPTSTPRSSRRCRARATATRSSAPGAG